MKGFILTFGLMLVSSFSIKAYAVTCPMPYNTIASGSCSSTPTGTSTVSGAEACNNANYISDSEIAACLSTPNFNCNSLGGFFLKDTNSSYTCNCNYTGGVHYCYLIPPTETIGYVCCRL